MSDKKHIDRLFQEKLKDFEANPSDSVWENIATELQFNKKQKKVIPLWLKIVGVAASLILLFSLGSLIFNDSDSIIEEKIVNTEADTKAPIKENLIKNKTVDLNDIEVESENIANEETPTKDPFILKNKLNSATTEKSNTNFNKSNNSIVTSDNKNSVDNAIVKVMSNESEDVLNKVEKTIGQGDSNIDVILNNSVKSLVDKESKDNSIIKELIPQNTSKNVIVAVTDSKKEPGLETTVTETDVKEKLSLTETIAAVNEEETIEEEEEKIDRWSVSPNIAPVYYNTLGKGSHIDDQFVSSSKTGEFNTSYGINIAYAINKKLSIRSGVHDVNLSYDTDNVILFEDLSNSSFTNLLRNTNQLKNITLSSTTQNIAALNGDNLIVQESMGLFPNENAAISQRIGYYEIPLELQYDLVNKAWGINLIGGFSTFLLNNNEVFSEFQERRNYIGKANNINNISFSANFGVGLDYKFSDKFKFNFEPTFKYQLNAFNDTSGNFKPYIIGVYTGFSFKF